MPAATSIIGYNAGSSGTYNLSGSGSLSAGHDLYIGYGSSSTGTFNQSGGTDSVAQGFALGVNAGSTGTYNLERELGILNGLLLTDHRQLRHGHVQPIGRYQHLQWS